MSPSRLADTGRACGSVTRDARSRGFQRAVLTAASFSARWAVDACPRRDAGGLPRPGRAADRVAAAASELHRKSSAQGEPQSRPSQVCFSSLPKGIGRVPCFVAHGREPATRSAPLSSLAFLFASAPQLRSCERGLSWSQGLVVVRSVQEGTAMRARACGSVCCQRLRAGVVTRGCVPEGKGCYFEPELLSSTVLTPRIVATRKGDEPWWARDEPMMGRPAALRAWKELSGGNKNQNQCGQQTSYCSWSRTAGQQDSRTTGQQDSRAGRSARPRQDASCALRRPRTCPKAPGRAVPASLRQRRGPPRPASPQRPCRRRVADL
jgi:hypothetical protein